MSSVKNSEITTEKYALLPPNVNGSLHGFLEIFIENISWTTTKTYSLVKIGVKFWGENSARYFDKVDISSNLVSGKKIKPLKNILTITYKVCTNHRLFQAYLKNCDPIIIEIFSSKTSDLIGRSFVDIPQGLHNLEQNYCSREITTSDIFSTRNFKLGEIKISLEIKLNINNSLMMFEKPCISLKTNAEKDLVKNQKSIRTNTKKSLKNEENKENLQIIGKSKTISSRDPRVKKHSTLRASNLHKQKISNIKSTKNYDSNKSTTTSSISEKELSSNNEKILKSDLHKEKQKHSLINYLAGESIPHLDEGQILSNLMQLSPSQSLIEDINISCSRRIPPPKEYCLSVLVNVIELNEKGFEDVKKYASNFSDVNFIFKCALTSKLFHRESMNFLSSVLEFPSHRIIFGKETKKIIKLPCFLNGTYLNFGFCLKTIGDSFSSSHLIGFSRINVEEVLKNHCKFFKKCSVINENNTRVGSVSLKIEVTDVEEMKDSIPYQSEYQKEQKIFTAQQKVKITSHPSTSNDDCENHGEKNFEYKNMQTEDNDLRMKNSLRKECSTDDHRDTEMMDVELRDNNCKMKVYQGILLIESLRSIKDSRNSSDYFITYEGFWNDCQEMTDISVNEIFNYLKQFPVMLDNEFLRKVQNNHMELKLWEKSTVNSEKLLASTKVPLHQFYIAFKDIEMIEHLSTNKLPVISTDTWCNFISPLSSELYCQAKVLLAIGNENQIDFLKLSRNLHNLQPPQLLRESVRSSNNIISYDAQIKNKLTAFIESLSQKLPEPTSCGAAAVKQQKMSMSSVSSNSSIQSNTQNPQLRKTSDLLETLQKALSQPPTPDSFSLFQEARPTISHNSVNSMPSRDCIKMMVTIEHAANLPKVVVKKCRNNKRKNKGTPPQRSEFEPHSYATFEATTDHLNENSLPANTIKSHEGIVYCTDIVKSINPEWNNTFEVYIPFDVIRNPQKKFVIKVWRKTSPDPSNPTEPKPFEDAVIGFSAIDLSVLLTKLPVLSGYYNLVDFSGRSNGQIKVTLKPLEDIDRFRNSSSPLVPLVQPLNIDVGSSESSSEGSNILSRTLKRKFTELDEITQRLRARLFDVTGDENFDPDEEFERDLNTVADEMDDINENKEDFGWLIEESNTKTLKEETKVFNEDLNKIIDSRPSTSKEPSSVPEQREITGCSSETSTHLAIDDLLKKYDLDTLINPNIFKNILDPTMANSDSTPTLNPSNEDEKANDGESDVTTVSSIVSNDQVHMIQRALQRASLHEDQSSDQRCEPDGTINES